MADEAYRQHPDARSGGSFKDKIAARREERASGAASDEQREIAALQGEIGKLWELLNNLKGEGGIRVELPVIAFTARKETSKEEGEWYSLTLCDGTTLEVLARNIVPPA